MSRQLSIRITDEEEAILAGLRDRYHLDSDGAAIRKALELVMTEHLYADSKEQAQSYTSYEHMATDQNISLHDAHLEQLPGTSPRYVWYQGQRRLEYW